MIHKTDSTQPSTPIQPKRRGRTFLINVLILIVVLVVAVFAGYRSGIGIRKDYEASVILPQLAEQFVFAEEDIKAGRYENAQERLEWIVAQDPSFPGVQEKLTEVLVQINLQQGVQSPTPTVSPVPTTDFSGAEQAFAQAQQQINAQDWTGALRTLDEVRKFDPNYKTSQVDGMYYFAFRNYGYNLIAQQGNLEGGIYQITLAERFGPLDRDTNGLREGARVYLIGASFWELDWERAVFYFEQARNWGNLWDGTMTATERYWFAAMRYGDELFAKGEICGDGQALAQYTNALTIAGLDKVAETNYNDALLVCFPPTPTFDPNSLFTPTIDPSLITPIVTPSYP